MTICLIFLIKIIDESNKSIVREAIEIRNISVHNDCVINRRYINKLQLNENLLGNRKDIEPEYLNNVIDVLYNNVMELDDKLIKKFEIKNCKVVGDEFVKRIMEQKTDKK